MNLHSTILYCKSILYSTVHVQSIVVYRNCLATMLKFSIKIIHSGFRKSIISRASVMDPDFPASNHVQYEKHIVVKINID